MDTYLGVICNYVLDNANVATVVSVVLPLPQDDTAENIAAANDNHTLSQLHKHPLSLLHYISLQNQQSELPVSAPFQECIYIIHTNPIYTQRMIIETPF